MTQPNPIRISQLRRRQRHFLKPYLQVLELARKRRVDKIIETPTRVLAVDARFFDRGGER